MFAGRTCKTAGIGVPKRQIFLCNLQVYFRAVLWTPCYICRAT